MSGLYKNGPSTGWKRETNEKLSYQYAGFFSQQVDNLFHRIEEV